MSASNASTAPLADIVAEARRVAAAAAEARTTVRITGGVAVHLNCPSAAEEPLARQYADIDLVGRRGERQGITSLMTSLGYEQDEVFNTLHGNARLFFWDKANARQVDVFLDRVEMCHKIELADRLGTGATLSLADLLLMKLQIVETNRKDMLDMLALLLDHDFTAGDDGIDLAYLTELTAGDWGLWRTLTMVAERVDQFARHLEGFDRRERVHEQIRVFLGALEESPKSRGWKLRAKVGDRKRWYELPEEAR